MKAIANRENKKKSKNNKWNECTSEKNCEQF